MVTVEIHWGGNSVAGTHYIATTIPLKLGDVLYDMGEAADIAKAESEGAIINSGYEGDDFSNGGASYSYLATIPCFVAGTSVKTANGTQPIEVLRFGDAVYTMDNGYQQICWIGAKDMASNVLLSHYL